MSRDRAGNPHVRPDAAPPNCPACPKNKPGFEEIGPANWRIYRTAIAAKFFGMGETEKSEPLLRDWFALVLETIDYCRDARRSNDQARLIAAMYGARI